MSVVRSALVTGATGFIGSALVRRLSLMEIRTFCLVRPGSPRRSRLQGLPGVELIEIGSFGDMELSNALKGRSVDVVFHLAAYGVQPEERDPDSMLDVNVRLLIRLLRAVAARSPQLFIHTGSCFEYGVPLSREPLTEEHPLRPVSLYGATKAASVMIGNTVATQLNIPFVTLRLFGIYGVGEGAHRLIPYLISRLRWGRPAFLTLGEQVRDWLYVDDAVEAFITAVQCRALPPYTVYNVCTGRPMRVREVAEAVADSLERPRSLLRWGMRPYSQNDATWLVGDNGRFVAATGWRPMIDITEGIRRMIAASEVYTGRG